MRRQQEDYVCVCWGVRERNRGAMSNVRAGAGARRQHVAAKWLPLLLLLVAFVGDAADVANNISGHTFFFFFYISFLSCLPYLNVIYVCRYTLLFVMCDVEFSAGLLCIKFVTVCVCVSNITVRACVLFRDSFCCACAWPI